MALKIISGLARGIMLDTPSDRSMRPTSGRAREALFSSLGDISGMSFADIFAGSGAIALEAASRGAEKATLLECNPQHVKLIENNAAKLRKAGFNGSLEIIRRKVSVGALLTLPRHDIWFFDPPYAESARFFGELAANENFRALLGDSLMIWEMPDSSEDKAPFGNIISSVSGFMECRKRTLGNVDFLFCQVRN